jgi:secreted PhoX family phosphatase
MKEFKIHDGMSIFDLALQLYGSIENVYTLITDNENIENINENQNPGKVIQYAESKSPFVSFVTSEKIFINTSDPKTVSGQAYSIAYSKAYK